jgi:hypothetical protein
VLIFPGVQFPKYVAMGPFEKGLEESKQYTLTIYSRVFPPEEPDFHLDKFWV